MADKKKILDYLSQSVKEYSVGVDLIAEFGSPSMAAIYRRGSPRFMMPQVLAILRRLARSSAPVPSVTPAKQPKPLPKVVADAKAELHYIYLHMVDFHKRLLAMGDDNSPEQCKARVALMARRDPFVQCFVELNHLVDDYFATDAVSPRLIEIVSLLTSHPAPADTSSRPQLQQFSDLDLAKEYKRIKSTINRRINQLRYSSSRKQKQLNPMPDSPERKRVVAELARLKAYLFDIMQEQRNRGLIN